MKDEIDKIDAQISKKIEEKRERQTWPGVPASHKKVSDLEEKLRRMELMLQREEQPISLRIRNMEREVDRINKVLVSLSSRTSGLVKY